MRYSGVTLQSFFMLLMEAVILAVRALILEIECDAQFLDERCIVKKHDRSRRSVREAYLCLGENYFHRAYRMSYETFWVLHNKLKDSIELYANLVCKRKAPHDTGRLGGNNINPQAPNGKISSSVRLALVIQYFAGGSTYDGTNTKR